MPFRTHGDIERWSGPAYVLLPILTGALKQPRARIFFGGMLVILVTVYQLTDWDRSPVS